MVMKESVETMIEDGTYTLTNKTIDGDDNTLQDINPDALDSVRLYVYRSGSEQGSFTGDDTNTIIFNTVAWDTDSAYNTTTGVYTVPESGTYFVSYGILAKGATAGEYCRLQLYDTVGGTKFENFWQFTSTGWQSIQASGLVGLESGRSLYVRAYFTDPPPTSIDDVMYRTFWQLIKIRA